MKELFSNVEEWCTDEQEARTMRLRMVNELIDQVMVVFTHLVLNGRVTALSTERFPTRLKAQDQVNLEERDDLNKGIETSR